jgi:hypothetical protein
LRAEFDGCPGPWWSVLRKVMQCSHYASCHLRGHLKTDHRGSPKNRPTRFGETTPTAHTMARSLRWSSFLPIAPWFLALRSYPRTPPIAADRRTAARNTHSSLVGFLVTPYVLIGVTPEGLLAIHSRSSSTGSSVHRSCSPYRPGPTWPPLAIPDDAGAKDRMSSDRFSFGLPCRITRNR